MIDAEAELIVERAIQNAAAQWPSLSQALACLDCETIFRSGSECLACGSRSLINVAQILGQ